MATPMAAEPVIVELTPAQFADREQVVVRHAGLTASASRFRSGVAALRIANGVGECVLLPFQGQQIWNATFAGRCLTMRSLFDEPRPTTDYLANYGAFFIHCGAAAMGNPGRADTHALHGELPNAAYDEAQLAVGADENGPFMELTGATRQTRAFGYDYLARPRLRLHRGATAFDLSLAVENRARAPFHLMYLAHANFRPIDGAQLLDSVADDRRDVTIRPPPPAGGPHALHEAVVADPTAHRSVRPGAPVDPELVLTMRAASGADGWAHALQRHPNGTGDFISWRPAELPYAVRWLVRNADQDALGLALPATAPPDGLAAAQAAGQLVRVDAGRTFHARMRLGMLDAEATERFAGMVAAAAGRR